MATIEYHLRLDIRNFLRGAIDMNQLQGMFRTAVGRSLSADDAFDFLIDKLQQGHNFLQFGDCKGFDPIKEGCPGHPLEPIAPTVELRD